MARAIFATLVALGSVTVESIPSPSALRGAGQETIQSLRVLQDQLPTCSNGVFGIQSSDSEGDVCCVAACGQCGGTGCSSPRDPDLGASDCCVSEIKEADELCSIKGAAPCVVDAPAKTCSNGIPGIESPYSEFCCEEICGVCGGPGCSDFAEGHMCCVSDIDESGVMCSTSLEAPCIIGDDDTPTPPEPVQSPPTAAVPASSGDIDGDGEIDGYAYEGCYENPVEDPFTSMMTSDDMTPQMCFEVCAGVSATYMGLLEGKKCGCGTSTHIMMFAGKPGTCDMKCAGSTSHTCGGSMSYEEYRLVDYNIGLDGGNNVGGLMECSNGIPGVESASGDVCCKAACGTCGGSRCVGTGGCCEEYIKDNEDMCDDVGAAPCVISNR